VPNATPTTARGSNVALDKPGTQRPGLACTAPPHPVLSPATQADRLGHGAAYAARPASLCPRRGDRRGQGSAAWSTEPGVGNAELRIGTSGLRAGAGDSTWFQRAAETDRPATGAPQSAGVPRAQVAWAGPRGGRPSQSSSWPKGEPLHPAGCGRPATPLRVAGLNFGLSSLRSCFGFRTWWFECHSCHNGPIVRKGVLWCMAGRGGACRFRRAAETDRPAAGAPHASATPPGLRTRCAAPAHPILSPSPRGAESATLRRMPMRSLHLLSRRRHRARCRRRL
jgi:hypothetical protein